MRAIEILKDNIDKLHEISDFLLKEETITGEEFMEILEGKKNKEVSEEKIADNTDVDVKDLEDSKETKEENPQEGPKEDEKVEEDKENKRFIDLSGDQE